MSGEPKLIKKSKLNNGRSVVIESAEAETKSKKLQKEKLILQEPNWVDQHDNEIVVDLAKVNSRRKFIQGDKQATVTGSEYNRRVRGFYENRIQTSQFLSWAGKANSNETQAKIQSIGNEDQNPSKVLQAGLLNVKRIGHVNHEDKGNAVVQSMSFHPRLPLLATGGFDKVLRIYHIDIRKEQKHSQIEIVKSIYLEQFPISQIRFQSNQNTILLASLQQKHLIAYDYVNDTQIRIQSPILSQNINSTRKKNSNIRFCCDVNDEHLAVYSESGYISILDGSSFQFKFSFKQNESCYSACFYNQYLFSSGKGGKIYQWSIENREIYNIVHCPGAFEVKSLSVSGNLLAAGTQTGIVNLFNIDASTHKLSKTPLKELQNLQTAVTETGFDPSGQYLIFSSKWKPTSFRVLHSESLTVFQSWPNLKTNLKFIHAVAISSDSKMIAFGNELGETIVYYINDI